MSSRSSASRLSQTSISRLGDPFCQHGLQLALRGRELLEQRLAPHPRLLRGQPSLLHCLARRRDVLLGADSRRCSSARNSPSQSSSAGARSPARPRLRAAAPDGPAAAPRASAIGASPSASVRSRLCGLRLQRGALLEQALRAHSPSSPAPSAGSRAGSGCRADRAAQPAPAARAGARLFAPSSRSLSSSSCCVIAAAPAPPCAALVGRARTRQAVLRAGHSSATSACSASMRARRRRAPPPVAP